MMIRFYSLLVLLYDIVYFSIFTFFSIVQTLFRLLCPLRPKSVRDEVAVVSKAPSTRLSRYLQTYSFNTVDICPSGYRR